MKIVDFRREEICYQFKDSSIKMERIDVWGKPEDQKESLLAYCQKYSELDDNETVHLVYLYGQGGVGKSFACSEMEKKLQAAPYREKIYVVAVDLQRQNGFEDNLKCLADEISRQTGREGLFKKFYMAYSSYKLRAGEEFEKKERTTKWDSLQNNATFDLAVKTAELFIPIGGVSGTIDLANKGYKWFRNIRDSVQNRGFVRQIEAMDEKELRGQLVRYFAEDFRIFVEDNHKNKKKFAFLLDTVESMRYQVLRSGKDEDYLDWLVGSNGLLRLMPGCFWLLFGREEIPWKNYDEEWEASFLSRELTCPDEETVRTYLMQQLGQGISVKSEKKDSQLCAIVNEIIQQTDRYCLAIENSVDVYFRIWNEKLRKSRVTDQRKADDYRPCLEEMKEMLFDRKGKKHISSRFLQYYTLQEREVLYTLICLSTWTDEILETVIWKGAVSNLLIYEEICTTSFVQSGRNGQRTIKGLMFDVIMEECSQRLKKQLFLSILKQMKSQEIDDSYWLLYESAVHIAKFCACEKGEWVLLGIEFVRTVEFLRNHAGFSELLRTCEELSKVMKDRNGAEDLLNAALVGRFFCRVFQKKNAGEELVQLREREYFGTFSLQVWKIMQETAWEVQAFEQAYEIVDILVEKTADRKVDSYYYMLHRKRLDLMQELGDRFEPAEMEEEIQKLCSIVHEFIPNDPGIAERINARLLADYYDARKDLSEEFISQRIRNCISQYCAYCTEGELRQDINICVLRLMELKASQGYFSTAVAQAALEGMRILDSQYGENAIEQPDMEFLFLTARPNACVSEEDRELNRRIYAAYYKAFIKEGNWKAYHILSSKHYSNIFMRVEDVEAAEADRHAVLNIILQGILYLSNLTAGNVQNQLRLLLSYQLFGRLMLGENIFDSYLDDQNGKFSGQQLVRNKLLNNQILLWLLQKSVETSCGEEEEMMRLSCFMRAIFAEHSFDSNSFAEEDKRKLLGLLELCGVEVSSALWKSEYTGSSKEKEFAILEAFHGWQWRIDPRVDAGMTNTVLYTAWRLKKYLPESTEGYILEMLSQHFQYGDPNERVEFWLALIQEAAEDEKEWEQHILNLFREEQNSIFKDKYKMTENVINTLARYDTRFEIPDAKETKAFEIDVRRKLAEGSYEDARVLEDYCGQLADACGAKEDIVYLGYTRKIVYNLEWLTELVPFRVVWRKERCIKEIRPSNFIKIYESLEKHLSEGELLDIFTAAVQNGYSDHGSREEYRPGKTELSFFDREYYLWMQKTFGEVAENRLREELPDLYVVKEEYERNLKNDYLLQMHKRMNEIRDMLLSSSVETVEKTVENMSPD